MGQLPVVPCSVQEFPIPGGMVLTRPDLEGFYLLNPSATVLWNLLPLTVSRSELIEDFSQACGIPAAIAELDVANALTLWKTGPLKPVSLQKAAAADTTKHFHAPLRSPLHVQTCSIDEVTVELRYFDQDFVDEVAPRLRTLEIQDSAATLKVDLFCQDEWAVALQGDRLLAAERNLHATRAILLQELIHIGTKHPDWLTVLHAGACTDGQTTIVFPAASSSGKTTLMAALMAAGLAILSDDSTAITQTDHLPAKMPYPMMIREGSWPCLENNFPGWEAAPILARDSIRVRYLPLSPKSHSAEPKPVSALVFPQYRPESSLSLERLDCWNVLRNLRNSGLWIDGSDNSWPELLSWLENLPAYRLSYADCHEAVGVVQRLFTDPDTIKMSQ